MSDKPVTTMKYAKTRMLLPIEIFMDENEYARSLRHLAQENPTKALMSLRAWMMKKISILRLELDSVEREIENG